MKKIFLFLAVAGTFFTSCSSDDDSNGVTPVTPGATAITLTSNVATVVLGGSFTFTVTDNLGTNVTTTSQYKVNDVAITSNVYTPNAPGTYNVKATNGALTSAVVTVTVTAPLNSFVYNGTAHATGKSLLVYLGTDENNVNTWVAAAYDETTEDEVDVYFTNAQVDDELIDFPTAGSLVYGATVPGTVAAGVYYNTDQELDTEDNIAALVLNIASLNVPAVAGDPQNWAYTYDLRLNDGKRVTGNFSGNWQFVNNTTPAGKSSAKTIKKVSASAINAAKKKTFLK